MSNLGGFWSYVHADDNVEGGRIARLARDISNKFEMLTGEPIELFLDRDDIAWGQRWRRVIDEGLEEVAFFIPVLTPRYFFSPECRRELQSFTRKAIDLGAGELIMPLLYVDVQELHEDEPDDELVALVKKFQWEDWTDLAYADVSSEAYRRGVGKLAKQLVEANRRLAELVHEPTVEQGAAPAEPTDEGEPGLLDRMAAMESALPAWSETITSIGQEISEIGALMNRATEEMKARDARGKGFAGRIAVARATAIELTPRAEHVLQLSSEFSGQMNAVDSGLRALIPALSSEQGDLEERAAAEEFLGQVRTLANSSSEGLGQLAGMINAIEPVENMSRDLRPPLKTLRRGLTALREGQIVANEWLRLIDESSAA